VRCERGRESVTASKSGEHRPTVTAVDEAGNPRFAEFSFNAIYSFSGFSPPVNSEKEYNSNQTLPIKFQLTDYNSDSVSSTEASLSVEGTVVGGEFRYDFKDQQYIFNLDLSLLGLGVWTLQVELDDGKTYEVEVSVKE